MNYFINFDPLTGFSVTTYRNQVTWCGDVTDLVSDARSNNAACCPIDGAKDALEDGSLWEDDDQETIEDLHNVICRWQDEQ